LRLQDPAIQQPTEANRGAVTLIQHLGSACKTPQRNDATHLVMSSLGLMKLLAALVSRLLLSASGSS